MFLGMSYEDFWDGDVEMARYYREKYRYETEQRNTELWLQGAYIYEALLDTAPALNALSKKHKPLPYRDEPIPLAGMETERSEKRKEEKKLNAGKSFMEAWAASVNANRKKKKQEQMSDERTTGKS